MLALILIQIKSEISLSLCVEMVAEFLFLFFLITCGSGGAPCLLDPRLSFVVFVGENAKEEPKESGVVDAKHDPGHLNDRST